MRVSTSFWLLAVACTISMTGCSQGDPSPQTATTSSTSETEPSDQAADEHELAPLPVGSAMPSLSVEGWLNGNGPNPDALDGKVVVIDVWAYW